MPVSGSYSSLHGLVSIRQLLGLHVLGQALHVILSHLAIPAIFDEVNAELFVLNRQILASDVGHEEPRHQHAYNAADGGDDKGPALAQVVLDRLKGLSAERGARLADGGADAVAGAAHAGRVALGGEEAEHVAGTKVAAALHEAVEDDEEWDDLGDAVVREADDEPENEVSGEAEHHDVLATDAIAEVRAKKDTRQRNGTQEQLPLGSATQDVIARRGHNAGDDGAGEDAVGEGDKVVEEPGTAGADEGAPVVAQHELIGDLLLDGAAAVELRVEHAQAEVEDGQGQDDADTHADTPDGRQVGRGAAGGGQHDEEDDDGEGSAEREGQVGDEDEDGAAVLGRVLVGGLGGGGAGRGILAACTYVPIVSLGSTALTLMFA